MESAPFQYWLLTAVSQQPISTWPAAEQRHQMPVSYNIGLNYRGVLQPMDLFRNVLTKRLLNAVVLSTVAVAAVSAAPNANYKLRNASDPVVTIMTNKGPIKVEVFKTEAPMTAGNFLDLVGRKFYNGLTFHRYEPGFCIQGGDPLGNGQGDFTDPATKRKRTIRLEKNPNLNHDSAGTLAMARSTDPDSASCQFYITLGPASFLDNPPGYAVFGHVVSGMDVVNKIRVGDKMTKVSVDN